MKRCTLACLVLSFALPSAVRVALAAPPTQAPSAPTAAPSAAPAPSAAAPVVDNKAEALDRFNKGIKLFEQGAYEAALAEFRASRAKFPTRSALSNSAAALKKLGRFSEALEALEGLLSEFPTMPEPDKAAAQKEIAELKELIGYLVLELAETDAQVVVDGRELGKSPLSGPVRVSGGTHLVRIFKEGFAPFEKSVEVASKATLRVPVALKAIARGGRLRVTEQQGKALSVLVDGVPVGKTPWEGTLPEGKHSVLLRGEGDLGSQPATASVSQREPASITLVAEPQPCSLRVDPTPVNAKVSLDGVELGQGVWEGRLRCGGHAVDIAAEDFLRITRGISLSEGQQTLVKESLEQDPSSERWKVKNPPRVFFELRAAPLLGSLGGDVGAAKGVGLGVLPSLSVGYRLGVGLGFSAEAGYMYIAQKAVDPAAKLTPVGLAPNLGQTEDARSVGGVALGIGLSFDRGDKFVIGGRLGAGVVLAQYKDTRTGTFVMARPEDPKTPYAIPSTTVRGALKSVYVAPELRFGVRLGTSFVLYLGARALINLGLDEAKWDKSKSLLAGVNCDQNNQAPRACAGQASFEDKALVSSVTVLIAPTLGLRYEF
jgi:PEGA domain